jgi:hypothetical protein
MTRIYLSVMPKVCLLFAGSLFAIFAVGLLSENQRIFTSCKLSGASTDECLLRISGR